MDKDKIIYELHKVEETTGRHLPILVGIGDEDMRPSRVDRETVEKVLAIGRKGGARPIQTFDDGRVQVGHYMYVPVGYVESSESEISCPNEDCDWTGYPTGSGRYPKHGGDGNPDRRCSASGKKVNKGSGS